MFAHRRMARMTMLIGLVMLLAGLLAACSGASQEPTEAADSGSDEHMDEDMDVGSDEHMGETTEEPMGGMGGNQHGHSEVPEEYADLINPLVGDAQAIATGQELFATNCAVCHGDTGKGDGPAAANLTPAPADFSDRAMMSDISDGYMFWRIREGGGFDPFNSAMPAWKDKFTETQIWQLIAYIRTLVQ